MIETMDLSYNQASLHQEGLPSSSNITRSSKLAIEARDLGESEFMGIEATKCGKP